MNKFQYIRNAFCTSSFLSQTIFLDLLQEFLTPRIEKLQDNPEIRTLQRLLGEEIIVFTKPLQELQRQFSKQLFHTFSERKPPYLYSEQLKEILDNNQNEIIYLRREWLNFLIEQNIITKLSEKNITLSQPTEKELRKIKESEEIITKRIMGFFEEMQVNMPKDEICVCVFKKSEIRTLFNMLQLPANLNIYFDEDTWNLYIKEIKIPFKKGSMNGIFVREFFRNEEKTTYYYDVLQEYDDRNISEKKANQKGSTIITKINQKIYENTKIQDFFSRGKGLYYRKNSL